MRVTETVKLFGGSLVIYFVVAACSAAYTEQAEPPLASSAGPAPAKPSSPLDPVPVALADGTKSGTRLKLQFWEGSDGSRQFVQFFDSQLQTPCTVSASSTTSDGKVRCLPPVVGSLYFSDPMCKTPGVYAVDKTLTPQPKVVAVQPGFGGGTHEHYTLKGLINAPATAYVDIKGGANGCQALALPADYNYYEVGPPLPPTTFVEMTMKTE